MCPSDVPCGAPGRPSGISARALASENRRSARAARLARAEQMNTPKTSLERAERPLGHERTGELLCCSTVFCFLGKLIASEPSERPEGRRASRAERREPGARGIRAERSLARELARLPRGTARGSRGTSLLGSQKDDSPALWLERSTPDFFTWRCRSSFSLKIEPLLKNPL